MTSARARGAAPLIAACCLAALLASGPAMAAGPGSANPGEAASWPFSYKAGVALTVTGLTFGIAGTALGGLEVGEEGIITMHCRSRAGLRRCDDIGKSAVSDAFALLHGARLALALGGVAFTGGVGMLWLGGGRLRGANAATGRLTLVPVLGPSTGGIALRGSF